MTSIVLHAVSGSDGMLHFEVPVGQADTEFEVELIVRPRMPPRAFPSGYFDLLGSLDDDTLTVHPPNQTRNPP